MGERPILDKALVENIVELQNKSDIFIERNSKWQQF
jgi:hypothetical protein